MTEKEREGYRRRSKTYRDNNKEKIKLSRDDNKDYYAQYAKDNKQNIKTNQSIWRENNKIRLQTKRNEYNKNKRLVDELFKLSSNIRTLIGKAIRAKGYSKTKKTTEILGCSLEEFKAYLEANFEPWMNWDNYGKYNGELNYGWDIDHIKPLAMAANESELLELNKYINLQPLCSYTNRVIKKDNYETTG